MNEQMREAARAIVQGGRAAGLPVRLFGGLAIFERGSERSRAALGREYADVDLVAHRRGSRELRELLERERYEPERVFNATHGASRLLYHAPDRSFHIDVFLDRFEMSHKLDFSERLELDPMTLPAADLLLAKLQVAEVNRKDLSDAAMLLLDHELAEIDGEGRLNASHLAGVLADDWGFTTTSLDNLGKLDALAPELPLERGERSLLSERTRSLRERIEREPKTRAWKLRAKIGRRKRWYELPEEVSR
ncbi:MAG: hypothetical protein ACYCUM_11230 [Solirubrobacteraceae bacterium]